jgi:hypothetical protein
MTNQLFDGGPFNYGDWERSKGPAPQVLPAEPLLRVLALAAQLLLELQGQEISSDARAAAEHLSNACQEAYVPLAAGENR